MSTLQLAWRLARAGGRFRGLAVVGGNAVASCLMLLALSLPAAIRPTGQVTTEARVQAISVVLCLCLPIAVLAMSLGRLSASTRDRRLAALRLLGLTPGRTRGVAAAENGLLAGAGVLVGLAAAAGAVPLVTRALATQGWLERPLHLSPATSAAACLGLLVLAVGVSLAPTRALRRGPLSVRHEGTTPRPSPWRLVPLTTGAACLVATLTWFEPDPDLTGVVVMLSGAALTGVGLVLALPVAVDGVAVLLGGRCGSTTTRLAGRRLQVEAGSAVRTAVGLTIAAFVITGAFGVLGALKAWPDYRAQHQALVRGPQVDQIFLPRPASVAPDLDDRRLRQRLRATPGVRAVVADLGVEVDSGNCGPHDFCGEVFVGTCRQLALLQVVPGCRDDTISLITSKQYPQRSLTEPIVLSDAAGDRSAVEPSTRVLVTDEAASDTRHLGHVRFSLFVPATAPQIATLRDAPTGYRIITGPGVEVREAVRGVGEEFGVDVLLEDLEAYEAIQRYQVLVAALAVVVLGVGLLAVALTTIDRAIERRRLLASQVALGVPVHVLRGSQFLQTLVPLWLGIVGAVGLGALGVAAYVHLLDYGEGVPGATIVTVGVAALGSATVVAAATLPGVGRRLTPDLLRRE